MLSRQVTALTEVEPLVLGGRLLARRRELGLDASAITDDACTAEQLSRLEQGWERPDEATLVVLSERLHTSVDWLLFGIAPRALTELRDAVNKAGDALEHGDVGSAEPLLRSVLEQLPGHPLHELRERAAFLAARCSEVQGHYREAITELEQLAATMPRGAGQAEVLITLSRCCRESGDLARAVSSAEAAVARLAEDGRENSTESFQAVATAAMAHYVRGDQSHATRMCARALDRAERAGSAEGAAALHWNAALFQCDQGETEKALPSAMKALALLEGSDDVRNRARLRAMVGMMHLRLDPPDLETAAEILAQATEDLAMSSAGQLDLARAQVALARARFLGNIGTSARTTAEEALASIRGKSATIEADAETLLGQIDASEGHPELAMARYRRAVILLNEAGTDRGAADLWFQLGELLRESGEPCEALAAFRSAAASMGVGARYSVPSGA